MKLLGGEIEEKPSFNFICKGKLKVDECHFYKMQILIHNLLLLSDTRGPVHKICARGCCPSAQPAPSPIWDP